MSLAVIKSLIVFAFWLKLEPNLFAAKRSKFNMKKIIQNLSLQSNKLDRIVVDRRVDISIPGQTTQGKIDDMYPIQGKIYDINESILLYFLNNQNHNFLSKKCYKHFQNFLKS